MTGDGKGSIGRAPRLPAPAIQNRKWRGSLWSCLREYKLVEAIFVRVGCVGEACSTAMRPSPAPFPSPAPVCLSSHQPDNCVFVLFHVSSRFDVRLANSYTVIKEDEALVESVPVRYTLCEKKSSGVCRSDTDGGDDGHEQASRSRDTNDETGCMRQRALAIQVAGRL